MIFFTAAASLSALGCGSDVKSPDRPDPDPDAEYVRGSIVNTYIGEAEEVTAVPSGVTIEALVPQGGGGFKTFPAEMDADGSFEIPGLTAGTTYYLKQRGGDPLIFAPDLPYFYVISAGSIDLGGYISGRPDTKPITQPTELQFEVSGLNPAQELDAFELSSQGAGVVTSLYFSELMPGATAVTNITNDAFETFFPPVLIESSKGDAVTITQLVNRDASGVPYQSIGKAGKAAPFTMADGQPSTVSGSLEDVPQTPLKLDWKRSAIAGLAAEVHPGATVSRSTLSIYVEAGGPSQFTNSASPTVLQLFDDATPASDITAELTYGNPFPSGWDLVAATNMYYSIEIPVPGTDATKTLSAWVHCAASVKGSAALSITPEATPVKDIKVNGMSAMSALTGVGTSPTVSFSPSASGAAGHYVIDIRKVSATDPTTTVASFRTKDTSVTIPEGILQNGTAYVVRVTSHPEGTDLSKPFKANAIGCYAQALSSTFSP